MKTPLMYRNEINLVGRLQRQRLDLAVQFLTAVQLVVQQSKVLPEGDLILGLQHRITLDRP